LRSAAARVIGPPQWLQLDDSVVGRGWRSVVSRSANTKDAPTKLIPTTYALIKLIAIS
jgi:hypothetical protein